MSVVHLAKDPIEVLQNVDEKTAKILKELEKEFDDLFQIIREKEKSEKVKVYVITETSANSS